MTAPKPRTIRHPAWLDAAGITDPDLRHAYERCRRLHAAYGRTYYLATLLLPPWKRPFVNSLYGFARYADEIVDNGDPADRARTLTRWSTAALADLHRGESADPICRALIHTLRVWGIPVAHIEAFLASMAMDLTVTEYPTYADLRTYMHGSAAVIGLQMMPILEPVDPVVARPYAATLGEAFQLTNFLRDIAEDLRRGRVYLPMADLAAFGIRRADLAMHRVVPRVRELLRFEIHRTRRLYAFAGQGIDLLAPDSRDCIRTATELYGRILDRIEQRHYEVLDRRVRVGMGSRLRVAVPAYVRAQRVRGHTLAPA